MELVTVANPAAIESKGRALFDSLAAMGSAIVAYSGGADSAYLAWSAHRALGDGAPWSENPGLGSVQDPGRFISDILTIGSPGAASQLDAANYFAALGYLMRDPGMATIIRRLDSSSTVYRVVFQREGGGEDYFAASTNQIFWNPIGSLQPTSGGCISPALLLGHELAHAGGGLIGSLLRHIVSFQFDTMDERRVITGPERSAAKTLGESARYSHRPGRNPIERNSTSRVCP